MKEVFNWKLNFFYNERTNKTLLNTVRRCLDPVNSHMLNI